MIEKIDVVQIQYAINHLESLLRGLNHDSPFYDPIRIALRGYDELSQEIDDQFPSLISAQ